MEPWCPHLGDPFRSRTWCSILEQPHLYQRRSQNGIYHGKMSFVVPTRPILAPLPPCSGSKSDPVLDFRRNPSAARTGLNRRNFALVDKCPSLTINENRPVLPALNGFRYAPEGYKYLRKNIVSSPGTACKRYFRWLLFLYTFLRRMML